ncbi:MAG: PAS domain-containing protein [Betaproteobacteria bacterium]|nr:PAS domain-containing protein [Betaproteobacteria bacterium]
MSHDVARIGREYRRLRGVLIAVYLGIVAVTVLVSALYLWSEYRDIHRATVAHTGALTRALEEHVLRTFTALDLQLRNTGRRLAETHALERPSSPAMVALLRREKPAIEFVRSLYTYDAAGRGHTTSLGADIGKLHARDTEHFRKILESGGDGLEIGRVIPGPVTRRPSIQIARGILDGNGRFAGIIGTAIEPAYFESFYKDLALDQGASLALLRGDGAVLARFPEVAGAPKDISGSATFRERVATEPSGSVEVVSAVDGVARIVSFRHVSGWNLIVTNTLKRSAVMAPWRRIAWAVGVAALAALGILLLALRRVLQELQRRAQAEERFALAVQGSNDGIWDWNLITHEQYLSPRWKEILGYRDEEIENVDASFFDRVHAEDRAAVNEAIRRHITKGEPFRIELRMRHRDGGDRWILSRGLALRDSAGRALRMAGSITDITEHKQVEADLLRQTERLRIGQSAAGLIVMDWDVVNDRIEWSDSPEWLRGPVPAATGQYPLYREQVHPEDRGRFLAMRAKSIETLAGQALEYRIVRTDGEVRWVSSRHVAVAGPGGRAARMLVALHDITERKLADDRVRAALREKEVLLKEIYHRVKNNLQVVASLLTMQERGVKEHKVRQLLQDSASRVRSMAMVHEQLYQSNNLSDIRFRQYAVQLAGQLTQTNRPLSLRVPLRVEVADFQLGVEAAIPCGLILNELVSNAFKHAYAEGADGEIVIEAVMLDDGRIRMRVADHGRGLPEGFDPAHSESLGMQLVTALAAQLDAQFTYGTRGGAWFEFVFRPDASESERLAGWRPGGGT